jgi:hypothetical protein
MRKILSISILTMIVLVVLASQVPAQQAVKGLTNDDIRAMVKNALPEGVIVSAIKTNQTNFDISASGLIDLKKAGVTAKVMEAMLAAANDKKNSAGTTAAPSAAGGNPTNGGQVIPAPVAAGFVNGGATTPTGVLIPAVVPVAAGAPAWQPAVTSVLGATKVNLLAEATQIVNTKAKPTSLSTLAADEALNQALQLGKQVAQQAAQQAAQKAAMKSASQMTLMALNPGAAVLAGLLSHHAKQAKVTYVWALNGGSSSVSVGGNNPSFDVNYAGLPGVNPDQFEPVIVKLSPTPQSNFRLVGATEAVNTAAQSTQQDWPIYSAFVEDRIAAKGEKLGAGHAQLTPTAAMSPGEYAVALRPIDKSHKFSGEEVGKNQAEGLLFNYAWAFSVKQ